MYFDPWCDLKIKKIIERGLNFIKNQKMFMYKPEDMYSVVWASKYPQFLFSNLTVSELVWDISELQGETTLGQAEKYWNKYTSSYENSTPPLQTYFFILILEGWKIHNFSLNGTVRVLFKWPSNQSFNWLGMN